MAGPLAQMVRAKYPGVYDDMSDADLEAAVRAKYPGAYDDLAEPADAAPAAPARQSNITPPGREGESDVDYAMRVGQQTWGDPVLPGVTQVNATPGMIRQIMGRLAPKLMRPALGAQQGIRNKFPDVDLDAVALREGAVPGNAGSIARVGRAARDAGQAVKDTAAAAGPQPAVTAREVVRRGMRPLYEDAKAAQRPDAQAAVLNRVQQIRREYGPGLPMSGAQARKQILQQEGKAAMAAPNPKDAGMGSQLANAERRAIVQVMRQSPEMAGALNRSQELMALERAMTQTGRRTSILRDALAASTGTGAGLLTGNPLNALVTIPAAMAINRAVTSPQVLGRAANAMHRTGQTPATGELQALLAQLLGMGDGQE